LAVATLAATALGAGALIGVAAGPAVAADPGSISGTVTAPGGAGIEGVCVGAYLRGSDEQQMLVDTFTAADGTYTLTNVPSGTVDVRFDTTGFCPGGIAAGYVTQWYANQPSEASASAVTVNPDATTASINASMTLGGTITGHVTAAAGGANLEGICVAALIPGGDDALVTSIATSADGTYTLTGVPTGGVHVEFFATGFCPGGTASNFVTQWYNNQVSVLSADLVNVSSGGTTPNINAALLASGSISGTVTAAAGGAPLSGICVADYAPYVQGVAPQLITSTATAADGTYTLDGALTGSNDVKFYSSGFCPGGTASNFAMQWYSNQGAQMNADVVTVASATTTPNIDAVLVAGGTMTGKVTAKTGGAALNGMCVAAFSTDDDPLVVASIGTSPDGTYSLDGIPAGTVRVRFNSQGFCPGGIGSLPGIYDQTWYSGADDFTTAQDVVINVGATTPNIDAAMVGPSAFTIKVNGSSTTSTVVAGGTATFSESGIPSAATGTVVFNAPGHSNLCTITLPATSCTMPATTVGSYSPVSASFHDTDGGLHDSTSTNTVQLTVSPSAVAPGAPKNVHASVSSRTATVTWAAPDDDGGAAITGYTVTASPGGATTSLAGTARSATFSNLAVGTYHYSVVATNSQGPGPASTSNTVSVTRTLAGYWMLGAGGQVYGFGDAHTHGNAPGPVVAMTARRDGTGYWTVDAHGSVHAFGAATLHGGNPALRAGESVSTIAATPSGNGYWLFTNQGRAFVYGDAHFFGDMGNVHLNGAVIASAVTATGKGYYMVGSDGGVFTFGDAKFHGSTGAMKLNKPIVGISPTPDNKGYWLVASDGGVFAFHATFRGSMGGAKLNKPVNGLVAFGNGYLMVASDGGVFNFSNQAFFGSLGAKAIPSPIIGITAFVVG
jgi:hypothetical protein